MKEFLARIWAILKKFRFHWWIVYAAYGLLVYFHFLGFWGLVGMTVALILLNKKVHELD